jgi:hypothetical protein
MNHCHCPLKVHQRKNLFGSGFNSLLLLASLRLLVSLLLLRHVICCSHLAVTASVIFVLSLLYCCRPCCFWAFAAVGVPGVLLLCAFLLLILSLLLLVLLLTIFFSGALANDGVPAVALVGLEPARSGRGGGGPPFSHFS